MDGPRADVGRAALDPSPEMVAEHLLGLVSVDKDRFLAIREAQPGLRASFER